jgi:hypothetical protein
MSPNKFYKEAILEDIDEDLMNDSILESSIGSSINIKKS